MILHGDSLEVLKTLDADSVDALVTDPPYGLRFMSKHWDYDVPNAELWREVLRVLKPGAHALIACGTRTQHRMAVAIEDGGFEIRDVITWHYGSGFPKSLSVDKAIDKAAGAERELLGQADRYKDGKIRNNLGAKGNMLGNNSNGVANITAPSTYDAKQWQGWGTALKPATEFWTLARKPLSEKTVAANVLRWGTGALNIDISRVKPNVEAPRLNSPELLISPIAYADILGSLPDSFSEFSALSIEIVPALFRQISSALDSCSSYDKDPSHILAEFRRIQYTLYPAGSSDCDRPDLREAGCVPHLLRLEGSLGGYPTLYRLCDELVRLFEASDQGAIPLSSDAQAGTFGFLDSPGNIQTSCDSLLHVSELVFAYLILNTRKRDIQTPVGRFPSNLILSCTCGDCEDGQLPLIHENECAVAEIDRQSGVTRSQGGSRGAGGQNGKYSPIEAQPDFKPGMGDIGGASRFFARFAYVAKSSKRERNAGLEGMPNLVSEGARPNSADATGKFPDHDHRQRGGNNHPCVKPIKLMQYLINLITPPGGTVLDCFAGSGSTGVAAIKDGFQFIGIERETEYKEIAERRIEHARTK